jgi:Type IV secretion system pilin
MDVGPIQKVFETLMTAGAALSLGVTGFFVMLAGYQYLSAGGSVRAIESAKSSLYNALIGFAIVILCKVIAGLVGGALGAPGTGTTATTGVVLGPTAWLLWLPL